MFTKITIIAYSVNSRFRFLLKEYWPFFLLILPCAVISVLFIFIPVIYAVFLSFFKLETVASVPTFVGLSNFVKILNDQIFWSALKNGIVYATLSVSLQVIIGVIIALILNETFKFRNVLRGMAIVPYIIPTVVVALTWHWILDGNVGIVSRILRSIGLHSVTWFEGPLEAMLSTCFISAWAWSPFVTLSFLAGLQSVPQELYEAARVDGANGIQRFFMITLPVLKPILVVVILLRIVWMFNKFDIVWLLTQGGPLHSTEHLPVLSYIKAFQMFDVGVGAGIATISFVFLMLFVFLYLRKSQLYEQ